MITIKRSNSRITVEGFFGYAPHCRGSDHSPTLNLDSQKTREKDICILPEADVMTLSVFCIEKPDLFRPGQIIEMSVCAFQGNEVDVSELFHFFLMGFEFRGEFFRHLIQ